MAEQREPTRYPVVECLSNRCQARVIWTITDGRHERMLIDAKPDPNGQILLTDNPADPAVPIARVERNAGKRFAKTCYTSHFATCPDADRFRHQRPGRR